MYAVLTLALYVAVKIFIWNKLAKVFLVSFLKMMDEVMTKIVALEGCLFPLAYHKIQALISNLAMH